MEIDPKTLWALNHGSFPLEINTASYQELLRIPGIGPISAKELFNIAKTPFRDLSSLQSLGIRTQAATPYILLSGKQFRIPHSNFHSFPEYIVGVSSRAAYVAPDRDENPRFDACAWQVATLNEEQAQHIVPTITYSLVGA